VAVVIVDIAESCPFVSTAPPAPTVTAYANPEKIVVDEVKNPPDPPPPPLVTLFVCDPPPPPPATTK
jgi:hypothetical protein